MFHSARKTLLALGAFCALAVGGAALAGAATNSATTTTPSSSSSSSSSSSGRPERPEQTQLTGAAADKVKKAALDKVSGGTVVRVEAGGHDGSAYHAHVRKSDGTEVTVLVDEDFKATSVETHPAGGPGHRGPGGPGGRSDETALTGDTAAKVKKAALDKVSGGTVERVETDADHGSLYEAHVRKSDGTEVEVLVNKDFEVTAVNEMRHP
ncbi:MAG: hypothetical protein QOI73_3667 [Solirubrobacteraceae bacterium]|nr:hypothetical protein [Solirubrobacteraceae bacterium]